jgi:hypothetical protein
MGVSSAGHLHANTPTSLVCLFLLHIYWRYISMVWVLAHVFFGFRVLMYRKYV